MTRCMVGEVVSVICDDTDVFALFLYFVAVMQLKGQLCMCSLVKNRAVIDIIQSVNVHTSIVPDRVNFNALIGADTPAATFGIGKIKALKMARTARIPLHAIGDTADEAIVPEQATSFILACYGKGFSRCTSMSEARIKMWRKKTDIGSALKLCSLPPTTEAFTENAKRAHLQAAYWKASIEGTVPPIDALTHGSEHRGNPVCHSCCLGDDTMWVRIWL